MIISFIGSRWPYQSAFENCTRQTDHELHHLLIDHITDHDLDHLDAIAVATRYCTQDLDPTDPTLMNMCATSRSCRYHPDKHVLDHADPIDPSGRKDLHQADIIDPPAQPLGKSRLGTYLTRRRCVQDLDHFSPHGKYGLIMQVLQIPK